MTTDSHSPHRTRIEVVDALRGLALLGLCLIHGLEHFDLLIYPETAPKLLQAIDPVAHGVVFFLFAGKAFAIFSFMFGLSFFIQMDRQARRGIDFRWRFLWRLALLFVIGYLHGLLYCGDVVVIFAFLGMALVAVDWLRTRTILVLSLLLVVNVPAVYGFLLTLGDPTLDPRPYAVWELYGRAFEIFSQGTLAEVVRFNVWAGQKMKWGWYVQEGRIWQILGLFLWGMVAGRSRFFESFRDHRVTCRKLLVASSVGFVALSLLRASAEAFAPHENAAYLADKLLGSWANLLFTLVLVTGFTLLYGLERWRGRLRVLAPLGRMSLTNYVGQSLVGVPFFYGFGLAMHRYLGHTLSLVFAVALIAVMIQVSRVWLERFHYGPLEWAWRAATLCSTNVPFLRKR